LEHCRQLAHQYEEELVDYYAMADLRSEPFLLMYFVEPGHLPLYAAISLRYIRTNVPGPKMSMTDPEY